MRRFISWEFLLLPLVVLLIVRTGLISGAGSPSAAASADVENEARLLVQKTLLNKYVVESMDVVLKYSIFNVGGVTATNIKLTDLSMGPDFELVGESAEVNLGRIPPGGNATHTIVARPLKFGYFNFTSAVVTYSSGENTQEVHQVFSSEPGEGYVAPFREFDKRFSPHFLDWAAFAIMSVPPLLIPFLLWHSSKAKYETVSKKSK
jgi:translocon-associated protein subunit beta